MARVLRQTLCGVAGALLALVAGAAFAHREDAASSLVLSDTPYLAVIGQAPDFTLVDQNGQRVRLADRRGRTVLLAFIYTSCKAACPLLTYRMAELQARLTDAGLFPGRATLLSVTVDPETDGAEAIARYAKRFDAGPGWHFLRESPEKLIPVLNAYDEWTTRLSDGELDHPARVYLIDAAGRVREIYSLAFFDERQAFVDILALEREARR